MTALGVLETQITSFPNIGFGKQILNVALKFTNKTEIQSQHPEAEFEKYVFKFQKLN